MLHWAMRVSRPSGFLDRAYTDRGTIYGNTVGMPRTARSAAHRSMRTATLPSTAPGLPEVVPPTGPRRMGPGAVMGWLAPADSVLRMIVSLSWPGRRREFSTATNVFCLISQSNAEPSELRGT